MPDRAQDAVAQWKELSSLYEQVEDLDEHAADAFLSDLWQRGHPQAQELARMRAARDRARSRGYLEAPPELPPATTRVDVDAGVRVGAWRLVSRLGACGMAEVWLAERDDGALRRSAAVKLLYHQPLLGRRASLEQRFARERDILATLRHPNIASLYDAGVTPEGQAWLALEFVEGASLLAWCDARCMPLPDRVRLFRQVLLAVQHAHGHLVIHRDLKPANVLVTADGQVRLLDFGIAKFVEADGQSRGDTEMTRADGRPLTPSHASPEQLAGQPLTIASDIFSLGIILYELMSGVHPYAAAGASRLVQAIIESDPKPPSRAAIGEPNAAARALRLPALRKALSGDLDAVVLQALARRPESRYATAEAFLDDLDRWLAGQPVRARTPSSWYRLNRFAGRHRIGVALGVAAVTALLALAGAATWLGLSAREEAARATAARDFMLGLFRRADPEQARGATITAGELLEAGRRDVVQRLGAQPRLQGELLDSIATTQAYMGQHLGALATFVDARRARQAAGDRDAADEGTLSIVEAAWRAGDLDRADQELAPLKAALGRARPALAANVLLLQGRLEYERGDLEHARASFAGGFARAAGDPQITYDAARGLAQTAAALHDDVQARRYYEMAAGAAASAPGLSARDRAGVAFEHTDALLTQGWLREALEVASRSRGDCVRDLGLHSIACRRLMDLRLLAALRLERLDGLDADVEEVRALAAQADAPMASAVAAMHLARVEAARHAMAALPALRARLRVVAEGAPPLHLSDRVRALADLSLADVALRLREPEQAQRLMQGLVASDVRLSTDTVGWAHTLLGIALLQQRRAGPALQALDAARDAFGATLPADNPRVLLYSLNRAVALAQTGHVVQARELVDRALPVLTDALGADAPVLRRVRDLAAALRGPGLDVHDLPFFS